MSELVDVAFDFRSDTPEGKDPDATSPTLSLGLGDVFVYYSDPSLTPAIWELRRGRGNSVSAVTDRKWSSIARRVHYWPCFGSAPARRWIVASSMVGWPLTFDCQAL